MSQHVKITHSGHNKASFYCPKQRSSTVKTGFIMPINKVFASEAAYCGISLAFVQLQTYKQTDRLFDRVARPHPWKIERKMQTRKLMDHLVRAKMKVEVELFELVDGSAL